MNQGSYDRFWARHWERCDVCGATDDRAWPPGWGSDPDLGRCCPDCLRLARQIERFEFEPDPEPDIGER
jgi:hypothetical protein